MKKTIIVCGFGPGISNAVAERFGKEGFQVALVARNKERLEAGVAELAKKDIKAHAFPCDLSNADAVRVLVKSVRTAMGPISALHWNAYGGAAGDVLTASNEDLSGVFDIAVVSLVAAAQEALPDLKDQKGALLITNGGLGFFDAQVDQMGIAWNAMGLSIANSAKHKLARMLSIKLKDEGVFVGEVIVTGMVKGTAFDSGHATLDPKDIAEKFWTLATNRTETSTVI